MRFFGSFTYGDRPGAALPRIWDGGSFDLPKRDLRGPTDQWKSPFC